MRTDFTPNNVELWIDNWKRKDLIGNAVARSWLDSFPFECVNVITNHSSVTIEDFPEEIRSKIKIWNNVMRHDDSRGPINRNINQAYVHTFLSGKKYCIVAHDSYVAMPGWEQCIINTDFDFYSAPQGDGFHVQTLTGLQQIGWWDERYATMGWHEIDYLCRALRADLQKQAKCSIVDIHEVWPKNLNFTNSSGNLILNPVGLEKFILRFNKTSVPQVGGYSADFQQRAEKWHNKKWPHGFKHDNVSSMKSITEGPAEEEVDWYPWLNLQNLSKGTTGY